MELGEFIKQYIAEHDMSMRSFAALVGMSTQQISNIIKGVGNNGKPMTSNIGTYRKIAEALGMEESEFMLKLNGVVTLNPSDEKIAADILDGDNMIVDLSNLTDYQREAILQILGMSQEEFAEISPVLKSRISQRQDRDS